MADSPQDGERKPPRKRPGNGRPDTLTAIRAARLAAHQVEELTGREPESVVSIKHCEDGWQVEIEVVETHRIPDSADILAVYQADLDEGGHLQSYRRISRYSRSRVGGDQG